MLYLSQFTFPDIEKEYDFLMGMKRTCYDSFYPFQIISKNRLRVLDFPEYFRELYKENTDLNIVLFYDRADYDDLTRYNLIKSHIITRAVENVSHTLTVDTIHPFQTAPTAMFDKSGNVLDELARNQPGMLILELDKFERDFGEEGRKQISDSLIQQEMENVR